ncbi:WD40 repeat-like protein [Sarocladium strictum]
MAPVLRPRQSLAGDKFSSYWQGLRSQPYSDSTSSRGGGGGPNSLRTIAWNPLSTLIATGSADKTLRVWNPEKPHVKFSTELKGHLAGIEKVAFNPTKDAELCSVSNDGTVKFWDVRSKTCFNEVKGLGHAFTLVWAPDGETLLVGNKAGTVYVLSPTKAEPLAAHEQPCRANQIAFCWSGTKIFMTTEEGTVRILSYPDFEPLLRLPESQGEKAGTEFQLEGHTSACYVAELQPTGRHLATGGGDSLISLWDTTNWICVRTITKMTGPVRSLSFTWDGSFVVGGSDDGSGLEVSHTETGDAVHTFKTAGACPVVAWAPTRYCLAYSDLGVLRIIGLDTDRK